LALGRDDKISTANEQEYFVNLGLFKYPCTLAAKGILMHQRVNKKLNHQQKEAMAAALASFFFDFWQKHNTKGNRVAVAVSGSSRRGGHPETAAAA
jgi:hypothetical protein